jgi:hypothetical protein
MISNRMKLPWVVSVVIIFSLIYSSSYAALLWQPATTKVDTRSVLTADYRPWNFLAFQPLDPAIIKEIQQERKLPDQLVIPGSFWPTSTGLSNPSPTAEQQSTDRNPITSEIPNTQPSGTTMPAEMTETPVAVTSLPTQVVSATPVPDSSPDPTHTPRENPRKNTPKPKNTHYPHPDK